MDCTWYLFSITQLLYLQDQELQTWLYKCYMCTSEVLSWHFLLFSFPFVHSHAFLFHLPQLWSKRGLKMSAITTSKRFSLTKTSTLIEKPHGGIEDLRRTLQTGTRWSCVRRNQSLRLHREAGNKLRMQDIAAAAGSSSPDNNLTPPIVRQVNRFFFFFKAQVLSELLFL